MIKLFYNLVVVACFLVPGAFNGLVVKHGHPGWWSRRPVRRTLLALPVAGLASGIAWVLSYDQHAGLVRWLGTVAFGTFLLQLVLAASFVTTAGLEGVRRVASRLKRRRPVDPGRRRFWQVGLASVPLLAAGTCLAGLAGAATRVRMPRVPVPYPGLHPDLEGFRILHLSDLHLSGFVTLETLSDVLARARDLRPDLIAVTGDMADDLRLLPGALAMLDGFDCAHGTVAVLGNHEYGNGVGEVRAALDAARVRLLVDEGEELQVGAARLFVGGVDDPAREGLLTDRAAFFAPRVEILAGRGHAADFRLLLGHRPDVFDAAADAGIELTLAGHTHGGQVGVAGRSLLFYPANYPYPWGLYRRAGSRLLTSAGAGHWLPFRLGCPAEAPLVELTSYSPR